MDYEMNGKQDATQLIQNSPVMRPIQQVQRTSNRQPVIPVQPSNPKKQNRGRVVTKDETMRRQILLMDYLQQAGVCKQSDVARLFGLDNKRMPSPLLTGVRQKTVKSIKYTGAGFNVYGLTKIGVDSCTVNVGRAAELKDVTGLPAHKLGVAKIISYLMSEDDSQPELWPGANDLRYRIKNKQSFIIGEPLMQSSWRKLTQAHKFLMPAAKNRINHIDWDAADVSTMRHEAYRFVIPPYKYDNAKAQDEILGMNLSEDEQRTIKEVPRGWWNDETGRGDFALIGDEQTHTPGHLLNYHVPDLAISSVTLTGNSDYVGIEFEISAKDITDYVRILKSMCISNGDFIYLTDDTYIESLLHKAMKRLNRMGFDTSGIEVHRISNGGANNWSLSNTILPA